MALDSAQATVAVLGLPDMVAELKPLDGSRLYSPGAPILLQGEIKNLGGPNPTNPFAVSYYARALSQSPPTPIPIATFSVSLPDSSSSSNVPSAAWTPVDSGAYLICMKADADSIVNEFDETNNAICDTIRIGIGSIKVMVERVTAHDTAGFRTMPAPKFPHPIFSYITVTDQNNYPISGLADSLDFIGPGERTDGGALLESIWQPLLEYHQENRSIPSSPNIYTATPLPKITEVTAEKSTGISVALLLDESGSMSGSYQDARAAVKVFVRSMSLYDQAAVIKFGSQVIIQQALTNDTTAIINAIDSRFLDGGTALYDAIYQGVAVVTKASGRKAVLVYTDGHDGSSTSSLEEVIAYAKAEGVPVYTLGFGGANRDVLQQIAEQTGGLFEYVEDPSQGADFYIFLSRLWKSYYVLAHATTDPTEDGTWRVVDVSVNYLGFAASDTGLYRAPLADLVLECAPPHDRQTRFDATETYSLTVKNNSKIPLPASQLHVKLDTLNRATVLDSLVLDGERKLTKRWQIPQLKPDSAFSDTFTVVIRPHNEPGVYGYFARAWVEPIAGENDTTNNRCEWKTTVAGEAKLSLGSINLTATKISFAETLAYSVSYKNEGNISARDVTLTLKLPDATTYLNGTAGNATGRIINFAYSDGTALGQLGDLPPGFEGEVTIKLRVFNREDLLDKYRGQTSIDLVFSATASSRNADSVSQSRTDALAIPKFAEAFYLSHNLFRPEQDNTVELYIDVTDNTAVRFKIYNVAGELVRSFPPQQVRIGGRASALWDGRNGRGDFVGSGLYFIFAKVDYKRERPSRRLVVVR